MLVTLLASCHIAAGYPKLGTVLQLCREEGCFDALMHLMTYGDAPQGTAELFSTWGGSSSSALKKP